MADASQLQLSPYALFDPSQWADPYSNFQNQALPAASYAGWPTNAMGQPIQPQPGMTINQTPAQPTPAPASAAPQAPQGYWSSAPRGDVSGSGRGVYQGQDFTFHPYPQQAAQSAAQTPPPPVANSAGLTPQQYMALRANPGPVPTYGATVPQAASSAQPGSGVLQQFLANWRPAQSGVGSQFQQGFSKALKGMGYS